MRELVQGVDDGIGQVLDFLDREGLAADTIVIYTTDNGWYLGDLGLYDKRFMYEPGLRVPFSADLAPCWLRRTWPRTTSRKAARCVELSSLVLMSTTIPPRASIRASEPRKSAHMLRVRSGSASRKA